MSPPRFYYYPDPNGSLETIDLEEELTTIQETPLMQAEDAYGGDGSFWRSILLSGYRVRISLERFGSSPGSNSLERQILTMLNHLQRGGLVGFSRDHSKTYATVSASSWSRGIATLPGCGQGFAAWSSSAALASGDEVVLEDTVGQREYATLSRDTSNALLGLSAGIKYSYTTTTLLRWRDFYPVLYLPSSQLNKNIVAHDGRRTWTLDVTLEYNITAAIGLWGQDTRSAPLLRDTSTHYAGLGGSLGGNLARLASDVRVQVPR